MIELKITDDSAVGFFKQLAEVAAGFTPGTIPHDPVMPEVKAQQIEEIADKPKRVRRTNEQIAADNAAKEAAEAEQAPKHESMTMAEEVEAKRQEAASRADTPPPASSLDFDKDVAPVVLGYVRSKGKPWVVEILNQFGVERASELAPEQLPELIAALNDAAAE